MAIVFVFISSVGDVAALLSNFEATLKKDFNLDWNSISNDANGRFYFSQRKLNA